MAGTKTAPTVGALTVTENIIGVSLMDISGDTKSEAIKTTGGGLADMAEIEAWVVAYQAASHASLFEVRHTAVWRGSANPTNAESGIRPMVEQGINIGFDDTDLFNSATTQRLFAPVAAALVGNSDQIVVPPVVPISTLLAAYITLLGAGYSAEFMQYTARRERSNNAKSKL